MRVRARTGDVLRLTGRASVDIKKTEKPVPFIHNIVASSLQVIPTRPCIRLSKSLEASITPALISLILFVGAKPR